MEGVEGPMAKQIGREQIKPGSQTNNQKTEETERWQ
jgi:hypothetical protein